MHEAILNFISTTAQRFLTTLSISSIAKVLGKDSGIAASVVIVTRNKATYLNLTLASLERQSFPSNAWEIVVVDDASADDTSEVLDKYEEQGRLHLVRPRTIQHRGAVVARNEALAAARGTVVVFLGDDCLIGPDFLMQHLMHHLDEPCVVLGDNHRRVHTHLFSFTDPPPEGASPVPVFDATDLLDHGEQLSPLTFEGGNDLRPLFQLNEQDGQHPLAWAGFSTGNASMPREQILAVGAFDESYRDWGLADEDLAYRLHYAGLPFHFEPRALSLRQVCPDQPVSGVDIGCNLHHFFCKHPDLNRARIEPMLLGKHFSLA